MKWMHRAGIRFVCGWLPPATVVTAFEAKAEFGVSSMYGVLVRVSDTTWSAGLGVVAGSFDACMGCVCEGS